MALRRGARRAPCYAVAAMPAAEVGASCGRGACGVSVVLVLRKTQQRGARVRLVLDLTHYHVSKKGEEGKEGGATGERAAQGVEQSS